MVCAYIGPFMFPPLIPLPGVCVCVERERQREALLEYFKANILTFETQAAKSQAPLFRTAISKFPSRRNILIII